MLDGLHEDLNRVMEKPYSELKDSNGRADSEVAAEAWSQHHARNQSIVIDLFYGQLKSKVSCLTCGHDSVRFDPFSLLSLPLPVENYTYCEVLGKKRIQSILLVEFFIKIASFFFLSTSYPARWIRTDQIWTSLKFRIKICRFQSRTIQTMSTRCRIDVSV